MLLKDLLSPAFVEEAAGHLEVVVPGFDIDRFARLIFDEAWDQRELKQRIRHMALILHDFLPGEFPIAAGLLAAVARRVSDRHKEINFGYMFLPDYIEQFGLDHFGESVAALEEITKLMSAEFAVRPFLLKYPDRMMAQMLAWSGHEHSQVRRLASEGCRPRLPWGMAVPFLKKDPSGILPVLENLKADPEEFVRRSVANNLNDISKDHPEWTLAVARRWKGHSAPVDQLVKHACRTLLKKGHPEAIALFDYSDADGAHIANFTLEQSLVQVGEYLVFRFRLINDSDRPKLIRLEYAVHFLRADGRHTRKVFKITEREFPSHSTAIIERRQHFKPITTRRYYPGEHRLAIVLNGVEGDPLTFQLTAPR